MELAFTTGESISYLQTHFCFTENEAVRFAPLFDRALLHLEEYDRTNGELKDFYELPADEIRKIQAIDSDTQAALLALVYAAAAERFHIHFWLLGSFLEKSEVVPSEDALLILARAVRLVQSPYFYIQMLKKRIEAGPFSPSLLQALHDLWKSWSGSNSYYYYQEETLGELIGVIEPGLMRPDEPWAYLALQTVNSFPVAEREEWKALLRHARSAGMTSHNGISTTVPNAAWKELARQHITTIGEERFRAVVDPWLVCFAKEGARQRKTRNTSFLVGLLHVCGLRKDAVMVQTLGDLAGSLFRTSTSIDGRAADIGLICLNILKKMPGTEPVIQLAKLQAQVKKRTIQTRIQKAYEQLARQRGVKKEDLEEAILPEVDLPEDGWLRETFGDYTGEAQLIQGQLSGWGWKNSAGKTYKLIPKAVREQFKEAWEAFRKSAEETAALYQAQSARLEGLLRVGRVWALADWQARYPKHPILSDLASRLIWEVSDEERIVAALWQPNGFTDGDGRPLERFSPEARIQLWHPLTQSVEEVLRWRRWIEANAISQPFPQAHREIYVLTDAERETNLYSHRFANHVLAARRFGRLRADHGWRFETDSTVVSAYQPRYAYSQPLGHPLIKLALPQFSMRAEFWLEYVGDFDQRIALTEQLRFVDKDHSPIPLEQIPPLVLSEVMRDVDFFVNSTSIASDPDMQEQIEEAHRDVWQKVAFGELNHSAETRREILTRLLPRLHIGERCTLDERFLIVRGDVRTYKIHLGSGNILMEPNDQYLCIVPDRSGTEKRDSRLALPFEGDQTFALIVSKAFLLAEDSAITDTTILRQIKRQ